MRIIIQVILATHVGLGKAMLETAAVICGETDGVGTVGLYPGDGAEDVESALRSFISETGASDDILCLVDIPGGTPARVAATLALEMPNVACVSGLNLAMLAEALLLRDSMGIDDLKSHVMVSANSSVTDIGDSVRKVIAEESG